MAVAPASMLGPRCAHGDACETSLESYAVVMEGDACKAEHRRDVEALKSLAADLRGRVEEMQEERTTSPSPLGNLGAVPPDSEPLMRYVNQCLQASRAEMAKDQAKTISVAEHWARTAEESMQICSEIAAKLQSYAPVTDTGSTLSTPAEPQATALPDRFEQSFSSLRTEFQAAIEQEHELINRGVQAAVEEFYKEVEQGMVERVTLAAREVARKEVIAFLSQETSEQGQEMSPVAGKAPSAMEGTAQKAQSVTRASSSGTARVSRTPRPQRPLIIPAPAPVRSSMVQRTISGSHTRTSSAHSARVSEVSPEAVLNDDVATFPTCTPPGSITPPPGISALRSFDKGLAAQRMLTENLRQQVHDLENQAKELVQASSCAAPAVSTTPPPGTSIAVAASTAPNSSVAVPCPPAAGPPPWKPLSTIAGQPTSCGVANAVPSTGSIRQTARSVSPCWIPRKSGSPTPALTATSSAASLSARVISVSPVRTTQKSQVSPVQPHTSLCATITSMRPAPRSMSPPGSANLPAPVATYFSPPGSAALPAPVTGASLKVSMRGRPVAGMDKVAPPQVVGSQRRYTSSVSPSPLRIRA